MRARHETRWPLAALPMLMLMLAGCDTGGSSETAADDDARPRIGGDAAPPIAIDAGGPRPDGAASTDAAAPIVDAAPGPPDARPPAVGTAGIRGTVWAPGNRPGQVRPGHEIPISGALVNLTVERMAPIPPGIYCEMCVDTPPTAVLTDARGRFEIVDHPEGEYWLTIQKGQFRREHQVRLVADEMYEMPDAASALSARHDPENGRWTPRIALALGTYDRIEEVLGKLGMGQVDGDGGFVANSTQEPTFNIDMYDNGGGDFDERVVGTLSTLVHDRALLQSYHIIFIPCSGSGHTDALLDERVRQNLREYVTRGGKLFVTDWSGEWHDNIFPAQVQLGPGEDTPAEAWDPMSQTWNPALFGDANGSSYDTPNAEAVDADLFAWLGAQSGPRLSGGDGPYDARTFEVEGNWNIVDGLHPVELGLNRMGQLEVDQPKTWVIGGSTASPQPKKPLTVTYEPAGCGRVLYSTYHTADNTHPGLVPQERILLYLIMEVGTCRGSKVF